jgi:MIP family channel proteins
MLKKCIAEYLGTFAIVFFGCGAVLINQYSGGALGLVGISLAFGLVVMNMVYTLGHTSGAHINPAVTIALLSSKSIQSKEALQYIIAQCLGGISASAVHLLCFKPLLVKKGMDTVAYGITLPADGSFVTALVVEIILTFFLMLVIMGTAVDEKANHKFAGLAIGATVTVNILVAGPVTGASMNPARSLGPALIGGDLSHITAYFLGPIIGAIGAVLLYKLFKDEAKVNT